MHSPPLQVFCGYTTKWDQESFGLVSGFVISQNWSSDLDVTKYVLYLCSDIGTVVLAVNSRMLPLQFYPLVHGTFRPMIQMTVHIKLSGTPN